MSLVSEMLKQNNKVQFLISHILLNFYSTIQNTKFKPNTWKRIIYLLDLKAKIKLFLSQAFTN